MAHTLMTAHRGKAALIALVLAALLLVAILVAWLVIDTGEIRSRLAAGLGEALGMQVQIRQPLELNLLPRPGVTVEGLEASKDGKVVATAASVQVGFAWSRLLTGNLQPVNFHIRQLELAVERSAAGELNLPVQQAGELDPLSLGRAQVSDARITYLDRSSEREWRFERCALNLHDIRHGGGTQQQVLESLAAGGEIRCNGFSQDRFRVADLLVRIRGERGALELDPVSATAFGGDFSGRIKGDFSSETPTFSLDSTLSGFELSTFMNVLNPDQQATGQIDMELALEARGGSWQALRQSAAGSFGMHSRELTFKGYDLDEELKDYAETQSFNLVDVGAVFLAGPVGLAVSRGYEFTGLLGDSEGTTTIEQMVSEWTVDQGVAQASDVAFRTPRHRLALQGALDFGNVSFENLRVAVVDADGCAVVEQQITGPFHDPEIQKPNVLVAVTGPMLDLVQRGVRAITNRDCDTFYSGSLPHP